jgi:hypothetical protein
MFMNERGGVLAHFLETRRTAGLGDGTAGRSGTAPAKRGYAWTE